MEDPILTITLPRLVISFVPAVAVVGIMWWWALSAGTAVYGLARMLIQLLMIGFLLTLIFETDQALVVSAVLAVMLLVAAWIAMRPLAAKARRQYGLALIAIAVGGISTLSLITGLVLNLDPWFMPRYMVPIAGMIFAGSMNAVSLAAERFASEREAGNPAEQARRSAMEAALIPVMNSLFAVGLVSLPGMMTGQILAGTSPLVAVRYQVVVMCMLFGAAGLSVAIYLALAVTRSRHHAAT